MRMRATVAFLLLSICQAQATIGSYKFSEEDVIRRDVAVLGGGASGAHAAVLLRQDYNKSVVVIERQNILGGHVDTYFDKESNTIQDYGVRVYFPYGDALSFFDRFNLTLQPMTFPGEETIYVDFSTGEELANYSAPDQGAGFAAMQKFVEICEENGYDKMTTPGYWDLPSGPDIPEDLLMPLGAFFKKYDIEAMLPLMYSSTAGGVGSRGKFEELLMFTFMKAFPVPWAKAFLGIVPMSSIEGGNQVLYDRIAESLGDDNVLYGSVVVETERDDSEVKLVVDSAKERKLIVARRLLVSFQATRENLKPFDLNSEEKEHFDKPRYGRSQTGLVAHSKLPLGLTVRNVPAGSDPSTPFLEPPFVLSFQNRQSTNVFAIGGSGPYDIFDSDAAIALAQDALEKMAAAGTIPDLEGEKMRVLAWEEHGPGGFGVSAEDMKDGWMERMYAMQGKRSTWWTGEGVAADFTTLLWEFNVDLLARMVTGMDSL